MNRYKTLIKGDIKNIFRDGILIMTFMGPILLSIVFKFLIPKIQILIINRFNFDLSQYYDLLIAFFVMIMAMLIGCMTAFILIEEKDEGLLFYFSVTPLGKNGYLFYRLATPICINLILSVILIPWIGLIDFNFFQLVLIILLSSILAIIFVLLLTSFATNRVEGLALSKGLGIFIVIPILDRFIEFKYDFIYYIFPTFYIARAFEINTTSSFYQIIYLGFIVHFIYFYLFYQLFMKKNK